jgi:predicted MFS family arabinose efflux permease
MPFKKIQNLHILYTAHGIFMLASIMLVPLFAIFASEAGASLQTIAYLGSIYFATKTIGTLFIKYVNISTKYPKELLILSYLIKTLAWLSLIFSSQIFMLFLIQGILGFSEGIQSPSFRTLVAKNLIPGKEIIEYANWELVLAITGVLGTSIGGYIATQYGFAGLFALMALMAFMAALISSSLKK